MKILSPTVYLGRLNDILMTHRVAVGFFFAGIFLGIAEPSPASLGIGAAIGVLGEAIRTWAAGYIYKGKKLARYGPYSHIRHPLYAGSFVMGIGMCVMGRSFSFLVLYIILFAMVYLRVIRTEEKNMEESFGNDYASYKKNVPLLLPGIAAWTLPGSESGTVPRAPAKGGSGQPRFQWGSVWRNKEYQAWAGIAAVAGVLYLKFLALT